MNALEFPEHSYDKLILIDTIYWVADIDKALASIVRLIKPGGKPAISPFPLFRLRPAAIRRAARELMSKPCGS